jgi:carbonic anhydrase/acetyltransferase-like protein (isoleucine patch superfamily)
MALYAFEDQSPEIHPSAWVADSAVIIGKVRLGPGASVWPGAVLRGDNEWITIGERSNVQENCVLHTDPGCPLLVGADVTVGHLVTLHGCTIGDGALVGIGAIVLNRARIGAGCLVGAGAMVTEDKAFDAPGRLIIGSPAAAARVLEPEQVARLKMSALHYVEKAERMRKGLRKISG